MRSPLELSRPSDNIVRTCSCAVLASALMLFFSPPRAQGLELTGGTSSLFVLGPLSGQASVAIDGSVSGALAGPFGWTGGARLGIGTWSSEAFARISAAPRFGAFLPTAGIELGLSARGHDDSGELLLSEGRASSRESLVPVYLALHSSPLRFELFDHYRLSLLELQIGTHLAPFGRFLRLNVQLISLGVEL